MALFKSLLITFEPFEATLYLQVKKQIKLQKVIVNLKTSNSKKMYQVTIYNLETHTYCMIISSMQAFLPNLFTKHNF